MKKAESKIPFNYKTIKVTQSRINKGLLAIPVSLIDLFPKRKTKIYVAVGIGKRTSAKTLRHTQVVVVNVGLEGCRIFIKDFK